MTKTASTIVWRGVSLEVRSEPNWLSTGLTHIEVEATPRTPLPITETGYRSAFVDPEALCVFEDAAAYVLAWLNDEAANWDGQLSLF